MNSIISMREGVAGKEVFMRISTRGKNAIKLMLDLATYNHGEPVRLKDIAKRQNIFEKYLEQIVPMLVRAGLLRASRGFQGGYQLVKEPVRYTVGEILRVTEGNLAPIACLEPEVNPCPRKAECRVLPIWEGLYRTITEYLEGITLQDILDRGVEKTLCIGNETKKVPL